MKKLKEIQVKVPGKTKREDVFIWVSVNEEIKEKYDNDYQGDEVFHGNVLTENALGLCYGDSIPFKMMGDDHSVIEKEFLKSKEVKKEDTLSFIKNILISEGISKKKATKIENLIVEGYFSGLS